MPNDKIECSFEFFVCKFSFSVCSLRMFSMIF